MGHTVLDLVSDASVQVDELQRGSNGLLELLGTTNSSVSYADQVVSAVDAMRAAAKSAETISQQIQSMMPPNQVGTSQEMQVEVEESVPARGISSHTKDGAAGDSLTEVVQRVRVASGLDFTIRAAESSGGSLVGHSPVQEGLIPERGTEVHVSIPGVLHAVVALASPGSCGVLHLGVHAYTHAAAHAHAWRMPDDLVFQRVSALAIRALNHFQADGPGTRQRPAADVLEDLLLWLCSYRDLFSRQCAASKCLLAADPVTQSMLPPVLRPYRLSRPALVAAASQEGPRLAFHVQSAPAMAL